MKKKQTYFYTVSTGKGNWSDEQQRSVTNLTWKQFVLFCKSIAYDRNSTVRGCETEGYNNQGHYFGHSELIYNH